MRLWARSGEGVKHLTSTSEQPLVNEGKFVSPTDPDWSREACRFLAWQPSRKMIRAMRRYQRWKGRLGPIGWIICKYNVLAHRFWSVVCGTDIPINCQIAGGISLPHPNGIVINPAAKIGPNCLILQQVTIGWGGKKRGNPVLGGHVDVGAGAKILGGITIGDHAKIGANAVVLSDVPPGASAVGIPARIIPPKEPQS